MYPIRKLAARLTLVLLLACLTACAPRLIVSSPRNVASAPRPTPTALNHSSRLSIEVDDVPSATNQAIDLAQRYGGRVIDRSCRGEGIDQVASLILAVPASNSERLRRALGSLAQIYDQSGWYDYSGCSTCSDEAYIYLELRPRLWPAAPAIPDGDNWDPATTFRHAWQVTASIFTFLLDVLIWVAVVVGPFVLIGLGILVLVRRARH